MLYVELFSKLACREFLFMLKQKDKHSPSANARGELTKLTD